VRVLYRARQFWRTLSLKTNLLEQQQARALLTDQQWDLFIKLQPSEMRHASSMYHMLYEQGDHQPDLLVAALLHDLGKLRYPMNPIDRAVVVLVKAILPGLARRWGELPPNRWVSAPGLRKAFVVTEQHARWGAEMAQAVGVSQLTINLIRKHHDPPCPETGQTENCLLHKLRLVDNES
jgi:putative nucleotidyltransferase with HDIG domain